MKIVARALELHEYTDEQLRILIAKRTLLLEADEDDAKTKAVFRESIIEAKKLLEARGARAEN